MSNPKGRLDTLCDGVGIRLVPVWRRRKTGQSHARGTMKAIREEHGEGHLIITLRLIRESRPNREELWSDTIGAVSDILARRPEWAERPSDLFEAFDTIDLGMMRDQAIQLRPWPIRQTMRAVLYGRLQPFMDHTSADRLRMVGGATIAVPDPAHAGGHLQAVA